MTDGESTHEGDVLDEAKALITGDRAASYGPAEQTFGTIAQMWSAYISSGHLPSDEHIALGAFDVAQLLVLMKVARNAYKPKRDNAVDIAGYAALAHRCAVSEGPGERLPVATATHNAAGEQCIAVGEVDDLPGVSLQSAPYGSVAEVERAIRIDLDEALNGLRRAPRATPSLRSLIARVKALVDELDSTTQIVQRQQVDDLEWRQRASSALGHSGKRPDGWESLIDQVDSSRERRYEQQRQIDEMQRQLDAAERLSVHRRTELARALGHTKPEVLGWEYLTQQVHNTREALAIWQRRDDAPSESFDFRAGEIADIWANAWVERRAELGSYVYAVETLNEQLTPEGIHTAVTSGALDRTTRARRTR